MVQRRTKGKTGDLHEPRARHEKVRFRRRDHAPLVKLPSSVFYEKTRRMRLRRVFRMLAFGSITFAVLLALAFGGAVAFLRYGITEARLAGAMESQLGAMLGRPVAARMSPPDVTFDGWRFVAIAVPGIELTDRASGALLANAGTLRFSVDLPSLAVGRIALTGIAGSDAAIDISALAPAGAPTDTTALTPDAMAVATFAAVRAVFEGLSRSGTRRIDFDRLDLRDGERLHRIGHLLLSRSGEEELLLEAQVETAPWSHKVTGAARLGPDGRTVAQVDMAVETDGRTIAAASSAFPGLAVSPVRLTLSGTEGSASRIAFTAAAERVTVSYQDGRAYDTAIDVAGEIATGSGKIEFDRFNLVSGATALKFQGAAKPVDGDKGQSAQWRYEFVSDDSVIAPADSSEPALPIASKLAGVWSPGGGRIGIDTLHIRTRDGEVFGAGSVTLSQKGPGIFLEVHVSDLPVGHAKQIWPTYLARSARDWTLDNLFGGVVREGRIDVHLTPEALVKPEPFDAQDVSGRFAVENARVNIAGELPPLRDTVGVIAFGGADVDIRVSSARIYLPSGRTLDASDGTMLIPRAEPGKLGGQLDVKVRGDAAAAAEYAAYQPIDAMRFLPFSDDDLSGTMQARVVADIPFSGERARTELDYKVSLAISKVAIARKFGNQQASEADGTVEIDRQKAIVNAKGRLNGVPAVFEFVEPIGESKTARKQVVTLAYDDKSRNQAAPGLASLLSGPISVRWSRDGAGVQTVKANLDKAKLNIPWIGWSKGAGIAAEASFTMAKAGEQYRLDDFRLSGKSFAAEGRLVLSEAGLVSADFTRVRLNPDDAAKVAIARDGKTYVVKVSGPSIDGRSMIKRATSDNDDIKSGLDEVTVKVKANVAAVTGFSGEVMRDFRLEFATNKGKFGGMSIDAVTKSGGSVRIDDGTDGGKRTVTMTSDDAGAILRFLDIYDRMNGGSIDLSLSARGGGPLSGEVDARDFSIVDEPRLRSLVASHPPGEEQSLSDAVNKDIDTTVVKFERGFTRIEKGKGYLNLADGILRGPLLGFSFQGKLYDKESNMALTGTMMPAYGLNRIFGEIPIVGILLGNGRDRGLIGVTFKLSGPSKDPKLQVNPISVIAPGIFRSIFEYR